MPRSFVFAGLVAAVALGIALSTEGHCCIGDNPGCLCFVDTGAWDPSGPDIQAIAHDTVGTRESCLPNGGKPYYQMQLGIDDRSLAQMLGCAYESLDDLYRIIGLTIFSLVPRSAWCSEAVSYWHREAGIPYPTGYRNSTFFLDWKLNTTYAIQTFYETEESAGGRGRWINWDELDYGDFRPGENAPVPGAYVLIRKYDAEEEGWIRSGSHSMMIDEMTVYLDPPGRVMRVEATILEGNAGNKVRADRVLEDILSLTPAGDKWIPGQRKILGFGIDLDARGNPIYTRSKLRWVRARKRTSIDVKHPAVRDPIWESQFAPLVRELAKYSKIVRHGPKVRGEGFRPKGIPDGRLKWIFPERGAAVEIDLLAVHPLPIKGLILSWEGYIPRGIQVEWAGADRRFREVQVPELAELSGAFRGTFPFPIVFGKTGVKVRYVRIHLPSQGRKVTLAELRFVYDWGPWEDEEADF